MQQQHNLEPGSKRTQEYQLTDTISLVTFLDDSGTARYILVDKKKQNGGPKCAKFTIEQPFEITGLQNYLFKIYIKTGQLFCYNKAGGMYRQLHPRSINKTTLTYVDKNGDIHCLDLTQGCGCITDNNLKNFFSCLSLIDEAEKYKILSALIALDRYGMEQKLNLNVPYFISSYKDFLKYMIKLNHGLWRKLLLICSQFGSYNKNAKEEIIDVIREEKEKLNNNQIYYGNNRNCNYNQNKNNNNNFYTSQNNNFNNNYNNQLNNNQLNNNMNYNQQNYGNLYNNIRNYNFNNFKNNNQNYNNLYNNNRNYNNLYNNNRNNNNLYNNQQNYANNNNFQQNVFNNFNFNQQNWQQQFAVGENQVLNDIYQFNSQNLDYKYQTVCNYYFQSDLTKYWEIRNFYNNNPNDFNKLNDFYNKKYAEYLIKKYNANSWKILVSKCNQYYPITNTLRKFLEDANCKYLKLFLERPLVALNQQQKMKIIQETFDQNDLKPLSQYKSFFYDYYSDTTCFLKFLFWYAQQQDLPNNPNVTTLAGLLGNYFPSEFEKNRCNSLLNLNNGNQLAGNDKILAYYIGYILFSNYTNTQGESYMLQQIQNIFPYLSKYGYETTFVIDGYKQQYVFDSGSKGYVLKNIPFGRYFKIPGSEKVGVTDWFPGAKPILVGGVEICKPKPMDDDVKECLEKLSEGGINELPKEGYEYTTENEVTTIKKGDKLIFEGILSEDGKGLKEGELVIKYDNQGQPDEYYQGQFKGTQMNGNGTYVFAKRFPGQKEHEACEGQFKDGQMHGLCTYYTADGFSAEITYDNGLPVNVKKAKDHSNTDVIVFDFFGFSSGAFEDNKHGGRYNSSFFITDSRSYQYKREKIFKLKDEEGMPGLYQQPNEGQQKAMDFIKTHMLIQGAGHYAKLLDENELRKIKGFDLQEAIKEFGEGQPQFKQLSQLTSQEAKEKWLCFVIDKIGPDAFNKLYLEDNMNFHFGKIQRNKDKKLKVVLNIHGTPQLGMGFGPKMEGYKEKFELINNVFQRAASLGRDMYVSNNSCFGSQFLDDKQNIFK